MAEQGTILGTQEIVAIDLQQAFGEGHIIVKIARFLEIIGPQNIFQPLIQRVTQKLEFLAELLLVHLEADLQHVERRTVIVHAHLPVQFAIGGDGFDRQTVRQVIFDRASAAIGLHAGEVHPRRIAAILVPSDEAIVIRQAIIIGVRVGIDAEDRGQVEHAGAASATVAIGEGRRTVAASRRLARNGAVITARENIKRAARDIGRGREQRIGKLFLPAAAIVAAQRYPHRIARFPAQLGAHAPGVFAAFAAYPGIFITRSGIGGGRFDLIGARLRTRKWLALEITVSRLDREGYRARQPIRDWNVRCAARLEQLVAARCRVADEAELVARIMGDDGNRAADGVAAKQRALRTFKHFDPLDVAQFLVRADRTCKVDAVQIDADTRIYIEGEVVGPDATNIGGQHR